MTALPDTRELVLGVLTRLRLLTPVIAVLWLLGIDLGAGLRLLLVPAVLLVLALDTVGGGHPTASTSFRVRPGGPQ
ncbi:hypothetical protein BX265_2322 [Streptomyces sp. TLI_235]|nr:hypothetical protein [Streptomyces sp. TLI_235]PBC77571.1 hypothetical protein BX265_2322 [Streptomyces sp. TLI_235]